MVKIYECTECKFWLRTTVNKTICPNCNRKTLMRVKTKNFKKGKPYTSKRIEDEFAC